MLAPLAKKMRRIMPRVAPMVRRIAMSRPLSFTSMVWPEITFNAATMVISERITAMTLRSTWMALKKLALVCCQSTVRNPGPRVRWMARPAGKASSALPTKTYTAFTASGRRKKSCAASNGA